MISHFSRGRLSPVGGGLPHVIPGSTQVSLGSVSPRLASRAVSGSCRKPINSVSFISFLVRFSNQSQTFFYFYFPSLISIVAPQNPSEKCVEFKSKNMSR